MNPSNKKDKQEDFTFDDVLASLPEDIQKEVKEHGIKSFEDVIAFMLVHGIDPLKMHALAEKGATEFKPEDVMLDDSFFEDLEADAEDEEDEDDAEDEDGDGGKLYDDEEYLTGMRLPAAKFIGPAKREYHIRIKLNDAPVKIWRELVVPSNITLELLAFVLLDAMGWEHEHLYQFIGKHDTYYVNSHQMKADDGFMSFFSRVQNKNSEKTSLEMVLQPKGERIKFEYDFGDSWTHDLWVKGARDYAPGEEPVIRLLKGQGACPPEDCGGVWGYEELLDLKKKKRKTDDDKERLEWYNITRDFNPDDCELEWLQDDIDSLWENIKEEMKEE